MLLLTAAGCSGAPTPDVQVRDKGNFPDGWPQLIEKDFGQDECAPLEGIYRSKGQSNSDLGERFSNPIFERSSFNLTDIADEANLFKVTVNPEEKRLYFEILAPSNEVLASDLYKQYGRCERGWFVVESHVTGGSGDSPVTSFSEWTSFGPAEDGSLLVNSHSEGVWRKNVVGHETRVSDIWYRFERASR